jgi:heptosyltransferase-1
MDSILIIRLSAIGDVVMASPLAAALRRAHPDARLTWLVEPAAAGLLDANPDLDEVLVWPRAEWRRACGKGRVLALVRLFLQLRRALRGRRFDLAIDAQGLLKSGVWAWVSGAPRRVGLGSREGSARLMTEVVERGGDPRRIGSEYLFLAEHLGLPTDDFRMHVALADEDRRYARALLARHRVQDAYAVLCPFTTRPQKHWVESRWADLAGRLGRSLGLGVVMLGGPGDGAAAARIADAAPRRVVNATGLTTLRQAGALIEAARLLVGVDTGLSHMGIAFGTPSVLLFGSTLPYLETTRADARVLYHPLPCSPCRRDPTCDGAYTCMRSIDPGEVMEAAREVIAVHGARA